MSTSLHSVLGEDIAAYVGYKRALGRKFDTEERALRLLDRFLVRESVTDAAALQPALIEAFLASRPRARPRSYNHLLGVLRCFFDWQLIQERMEHSPVRVRPRQVTSQLRPFLFEPAQVEQLLGLAAQLPDRPRAPYRGGVYRLIFSLMYGLGLRVGEIVRLRCRDVDDRRALLVIDKSKFGKTRLVPFGPRMAQHIAAYCEQGIDKYGPWQPDDPLFAFSVAPVRKPIRTETVSQTFHHLMPALNLHVPPGVGTPRLHCLRHSFAVATLLRWYRSGVDPNRRLFQLSTFMGHADPASTAWYLTITEALLKEASRRFERFAVPCDKEVLP
ncbi:tyrosine-type recombinase/integrase [Aquisalimonas sp.]|uniref:tyrosine-type recombinase/integrase n=1 Tax=Aquisalimonas sp. TaxID=1872621 RepID=UPI0025C33A7B|nr:tyrosine-type recombinase/integrase [Aquisalimonas sp.]